MTPSRSKGRGERSRTIMRVAVVGAGFTGLSAAYYLSQKGHLVTVFEKENVLGGLAAGFKKSNWQFNLEKHYHHWFTNDSYALNLIEELHLTKDLIIPRSITSIYYQNKIYPFNAPLDVLRFSPLNYPERLYTGLILLYLKVLPKNWAIKLEKETAINWIRNTFGRKISAILWEPLLKGKFGKFANTVNMAWFWARIKKRTPKLAYLLGGYQKLLEKMAEKISNNGGQIIFNTSFESKNTSKFDKVIVTTPSFIFTEIFPRLSTAYKKKLTAIPHLHAYNLLLISKEKFLANDYWLNINEESFPFIGIVQHTNLADSKFYNGRQLTWIANYLAPDHPYLKMDKLKLFNLYTPYLKKINPDFNLNLKNENLELFYGPFAQPVVGKNYSRKKPDFTTPLKKVYLANMDMVYPWDRGTNFAIELGYRVAEMISK